MKICFFPKHDHSTWLITHEHPEITGPNLTALNLYEMLLANYRLDALWALDFSEGVRFVTV
jgi:hypothetical protein